MSERFVSYSVKHKHHSQTSHLDIPKKKCLSHLTVADHLFFHITKQFSEVDFTARCPAT